MTGKHGAVMLFVSGLSDGVTRNELKSIFRHLVKPGWRARWTRQCLIRSCDIVRVTDRDTGDCEYHALVELQPAKLALRAIRELNSTEIHGKPIEIHRYHHRSPLRSQLQWVLESETTQPRPVSDEQRRPNLTIELMEGQNKALLPSLTRWLESAHSASLEDCKAKTPKRRTA